LGTKVLLKIQNSKLKIKNSAFLGQNEFFYKKITRAFALMKKWFYF
jgi:hypothetical protein